MNRPLLRPALCLTAVVLLLAVTAPTIADDRYQVIDIEVTGEPRPLCDECSGDLDGSYPGQLTVAGDQLFFTAFTYESGHELWVTDGTAAGTRLVDDLCPGPCSSRYKMIGALDGVLIYFAQFPELGNVSESAYWRSDGTEDGTYRLPVPCQDGCRAPGDPRTAVFDGSLFFSVLPSTSSDDPATLWRSDGTVAGTRAVTYRHPTLDEERAHRWAQSEWTPVSVVGGALFARGLDPLDNRPWTLRLERGEGAAEVVDHCFPQEVGPAPGGTVFRCSDRILLTESGFNEARSLRTEVPDGSRLHLLGATDEWVFYLTRDAAERLTLWQAYLNRRPAELAAVLGDRYRNPFLFDGKVFLQRNPAAGSSRTMTYYDPVSRGIVGLARDRVLQAAAIAEHAILFASHDSRYGQELWASDGTRPGTRRLLDLNRGPEGSFPSGFTRFGDRVYFAADDGVHGHELVSIPLALTALPPCGGPVLCLADDRFRVQVRFRNQHAAAGSDPEGVATALPATPNAGFFWFFRDSNLELMVKVLDGTKINGHHWLFWGGITDLEYDLEILDVKSGVSQTFYHPPGDLCGGAETTSFPATREDLLQNQGSAISKTGATAASAPLTPPPCSQGDTRLCLGDPGREFGVEVTYRNQYDGGSEGPGRAVPVSQDAGWFWFFNEDNPELMVKVLDGSRANGHHWVFLGGLSTVEYEVTVTDLASDGQPVKTYLKPAESTCGIADVTAFPVD